jgi:hypothetical protein
MILAPIVLFVFNRPDHTKRTLESLAANRLASESILYIYADGPKVNSNKDELEEIAKTRAVIRQRIWCKEIYIIEHSKNLGLTKSIVNGITEVINRHSKVIVLEDDIVTSQGFLSYINSALDVYENENKVMHVSGFLPLTTGANKLPETFFLRSMNCWGWGTWKDSWDKLILDIDVLEENIIKRRDFSAFDLEGTAQNFIQISQNKSEQINTWAIKWYSSIFMNNGLCLYPKQSLIKQIGFDGSGTHCCSYDKNRYDVVLAGNIEVLKSDIVESKIGKKYIKRFYRFGNDSSLLIRVKDLKNKIVNPLFRIIKGY